MAGEQLDAVDATAGGLRGDRAYALVDITNGKVGSAKSVKKFGELLNWQAQFVHSPSPMASCHPFELPRRMGRVTIVTNPTPREP